MSSDIAEDKIKKYKLNANKNEGQLTEETIELDQRNSSKPIAPSKTATTKYKLENIFDFNLKFNSISLERLYKKSYMPATRFLFRKYLFFIIASNLCWICYFLVDNDAANRKLEGELFHYERLDTDSDTKISFSLFKNIFYFNDFETSYTYMPVVIYLLVMAVVLAIILIFLSIGDIKESKYRNLKSKLKISESMKQVDCKMAEDDLKKALKESVEKSKEYQELSKRLNTSYSEVSKSRELYSKVSNPIALVVIVLMFGLCFLGFFYPPASLTPISHFVWFCEAVLMLYLIFPFQMIIPILFGILFSLLFEMFSIKKQIITLELLTMTPEEGAEFSGWSSSHYDNIEVVIFVVIKVLLHLCLHVIGVYLKLSIQAIKRDTFLKVRMTLFFVLVGFGNIVYLAYLR